MSSGRRKGPHSEDLNDIFSIMMLAASNNVENDDALDNVSHGICDMFSLFTFKELASLQRDNREFFDFMQALFYVLGHSDSKGSKKFISICRKRLDPKVNKLMNSGTPKTSMIMNQLGGARFGHGSIVLIFMVIWALICSDLLANPGTAITMSILSRIALSYSGIPWLKSAVMDYFKVEKQVEYPLAFAQGHAVIPLTNREGADGAAFASLSARGIELDAILDKNTLIASESHVEGFSRIQNLVRCANSGTCSEASDAIIGAALRPLKAADDARPRLSAEQIAQQGMLKKLEEDLSSERGKWSIWDRDEASIIVLMETIAAKRAEIAAMDKMAGLAATLPSLERVGDIVGIVSAISADALDQVTPSSGRLNSPVLRLPGRRLSPVKVAKANELALTVPTKPNRAVNVLTEYRAPRSISSVALTAIGIRNFTVRVTDLAAQYPGAEIDLRTVKAFSDSYQLLAAAQQLVGAEISVNPAIINQLVDRVFSGMGEEAGETTSEIAVALANTPVPRRSAGRKAITALVTEAAAEQAILNARTEKDITSVKISKILDGNIQASMRNMLEVLTGQLMSMSYPGGRKVAEKDARAAIDISRLFGVKPNLDTMDYAHIVLACNTGAPCEKKPYSELRDRAALIREMASWGPGKRFQHVKWNMIFSLLLLLPAGLAAEAALLTLVGIAGMPGRFAMWGVEKGQQKERLEMAAAEARARREQEEAEILHRQRMTALAAAPPPIRAPGRAGTPSRWGTLPPRPAPPPAPPLIDAATAASIRGAQETRDRLAASLDLVPRARASSVARPSRFGPPIAPYEGGTTRRKSRGRGRRTRSRSRR
jgi:hypothetical protein